MITFNNLKIPQCMKCNLVSGYITIIFSKEMKRAGVQDRKKKKLKRIIKKREGNWNDQLSSWNKNKTMKITLYLVYVRDN